MNNIKIQSLAEEIDSWPLIRSGEKLVAFLDENGIVHLETRKGQPRMMMTKKDYNDLLEYEKIRKA